MKRFVYISAHDVGLPRFVLRGYFEGKVRGEGGGVGGVGGGGGWYALPSQANSCVVCAL